MDLLGQLAQSLGGGTMDQMAARLGTDRNTTQTAIAAALPAILGQLNRNTIDPQGARSLADALERDHDGGLLDDLGGLLGGQLMGKQADGAGILGHIFGGQLRSAEQGVSKASGLDTAKVAQLMTMLAPIVMGALAKKKRADGLDSGALSNVLGREAAQARRAAPDGLLGHLSGFIDRDGDGSIADDLAQQAGGALLGNLFGRR
jgi:hypothetical protein